MTVGLGRLGVAPEIAIGAAEQQPALEVVRMVGEMRLELLQRRLDVELLGRDDSVVRFVGQAGRSQLPIERRGGERQQDDRGDGKGKRRMRAGGGRRRRAQRENAAADLGFRRLGVARVEHAAADIALELADLVAIDREVVGVAGRGGAAAQDQRPHQQRHREHRHGEEGEGQPQAHRSALSSRIWASWRSSSALSGGAPAVRVWRRR